MITSAWDTVSSVALLHSNSKVVVASSVTAKPPFVSSCALLHSAVPCSPSQLVACCVVQLSVVSIPLSAGFGEALNSLITGVIPAEASELTIRRALSATRLDRTVDIGRRPHSVTERLPA